MPRLEAENLVGQRFGRWTVIGFAHKDKHRNTYWLCRCECGKEKIVNGGNLKRDTTKSCGCLNIEKTSERFTTHGHCGSKTYQSWQHMIKRCANPNDISYHNYGGRGIKVCNRWLKFENFLEDMGEVPEGYQIDRINNSGNYCKSNCRWATPKENSRNTRINRLITFDGKTQCLVEWAEESGINPSTFRDRIWRGWSIERALTEPVRKQKKVSA